MESPLVSVVIITWNRKDDVLESIQSIYEQNYQNVEIVVVDNGSTDGTADALAQGFPGVKIVALDRNTGVSEGRNLGVAAAKGDIIFFLVGLIPSTHLNTSCQCSIMPREFIMMLFVLIIP